MSGPQLHDAEFLLLVSVECRTDGNCNTLLSSSLQRCYINGVCFAFQLAAPWKRRSLVSLGTSTHRKEEELGWVGYVIWDGESEEKRTTKSPQQTTSSVRSLPVSMSRNRAAPLSWAREPISCRQSIKPNQSTVSLVNGSTNQLGLHQCGVFNILRSEQADL